MNKLTKMISNTLFTLTLLVPTTTLAMTKTEAIYSNLNYDGKINKTTINVHLSELEKGSVIDYSKLDKITNINGKEKFSRESEQLRWESTGKDIYYQGKINDSLPITVNAKYYLNGKEVNPNKIKNKKGDIEVVFTFTNNEYNYDYEMYVPYVVTTTTIMNNKNNSNYEITNGKSVSTGEKTVLTAISAPGLYKSTNIAEFNELDQVTIKYNTTKFQKNDFYFVITPKLLNDIDISKIDEINSKISEIDTLQDGVNQLESGSQDLYNGYTELDTGLNALNKGIESALNGSETISEGLSQINSGSGQISSLTSLVDKLYEAYKSNNTLLSGITSGVTEQQLRDGINNASIAKSNLENSLSQVNAGISQLEQGEELGVLNDEQISQLEILRSQRNQLESGISQYEKGIAEAEANLATLPLAPYKIAGANEVISEILCNILGVDSMEYVNDEAIATFKVKINELVGGINSLYEGSTELSNGLSVLYKGSNQLVEGSSKIDDGTKTLSEGISKLNKEGISKLTNLSHQVKGYTYKVKQLSKLSKHYSGYTSDNADQTIFIYKLSTSN